MIHILIGAAIGTIAGSVGYVIVGAIRRRPLTLKGLFASALGGCLGGAVTAATLGTGGFAAASAEGAVIAGALGGSVGGATERTTNDLLAGTRPGVDVLESAAVSAAAGAAFGFTDKLLSPVAGQLVSKVHLDDVPTGAQRVGLAIAQKSERKLTEGVVNQTISVHAPGLVGAFAPVGGSTATGEPRSP